MDTLRDRRLYRSRRERIVFGVCGGLGDYFEVDPVLVRLIFVLITLAGGAGLLVYIIMAIIFPEEGVEAAPGRAALRQNLEGLSSDASDMAQSLRGSADESAGPTVPAAGRRRNQEVGALVLIGLGLLFILHNLGWFNWFNWSIFWPVILIAVGVALLLRRTSPL